MADSDNISAQKSKALDAIVKLNTPFSSHLLWWTLFLFLFLQPISTLTLYIAMCKPCLLLTHIECFIQKLILSPHLCLKVEVIIKELLWKTNSVHLYPFVLKQIDTDHVFGVYSTITRKEKQTAIYLSSKIS